MRSSALPTALLLMWPFAVYADGGYGGAFVAFFACGIVAFCLGAMASATFVRPKAKRWAAGCTLFLVWLVLLTLGEDHGSIGDLMFRMFLFMLLIMPIPFLAAFVGGLLLRNLLNRKTPKGNDA